MKSQMLALSGATALALLGPAAPAQDTTTRTIGTQAPAPILNRLEGVWEVEARIHPVYWDAMQKKMQRKAMDERPGRPGATDRDDPRGAANPQDRGRTDDPARATSAAGANVLRGVAEAEWILNDSILRENAFLVAGEGLPSAGPIDRRAIAAGGAVHGLSFFAFEPGREQYSAVFMNDCDGSIRYESGRYDVSSNQIIFDGRQQGRAGSIDRGIEPGDAPRRGTEPGDAPRRGAGAMQERPDHAVAGGEDVHVVLEFVSNDEFRVTMYTGSLVPRAARRDPTPGATAPGATPPGTRERDRDPNMTPPAAGDRLPENVVYQATYMRASGAEASRYRSLIRELGDGADRAPMRTTGADDE